MSLNLGEARIVISGAWLGALLREIDDADYCYVCGEHPSSGHRAGCPVVTIPRDERVAGQ